MPSLNLGSVHPKNVYLGGVRAKAMYYGSTRVWPRMVPWTDLFERTGATNLGPDWGIPCGDAQQCMISSGRVSNPDIGGTSGRWSAYSGVATSLGVPEWTDYKVTAQLAAPTNLATNNWTSIILGWDGTSSSTNLCIALMMSTASNCYLYEGSFSNVANTAGNAFSLGSANQLKSSTTDVTTSSVIVFEKIGDTYTGYKNGTSFITTNWTGLGSSSSRKRPVVAIEGNTPLGQADYHSPLIGSITVEDI